MPTRWPPLSYDAWSATCDTLHAHTQVLGKLAVELAPPEPQLQHAALRAERARVGDESAAGPGRIRGDRRSPRSAHARGLGRAQRRPRDAGLPDPQPARRRGDARGARGRGTPRRRGRDQPGAAGGAVGGPAGRGLRARDLRHRAGRDLLRGRHAGGARPGRVPGAVSRPLDAGQRLVGHVRPRRQPVLGATRRSALRRLHHAKRRGRPADLDRLVAGGPEVRTGPRSSPSPIRPATTSQGPT